MPVDAETIKRSRRLAGVLQRELGAFLGVPQQRVLLRERGVRFNSHRERVLATLLRGFVAVQLWQARELLHELEEEVGFERQSNTPVV